MCCLVRRFADIQTLHGRIQQLLLKLIDRSKAPPTRSIDSSSSFSSHSVTAGSTVGSSGSSIASSAPTAGGANQGHSELDSEPTTGHSHISNHTPIYIPGLTTTSNVCSRVFIMQGTHSTLFCLCVCARALTGHFTVFPAFAVCSTCSPHLYERFLATRTHYFHTHRFHHQVPYGWLARESP